MEHNNKFKLRFKLRLKQLREEKKLSQTALAELLNVSRGSISFYENGDRIPDIETIYSMCKFFDVTADFIIGITDNRTAENADIGGITGLSDKAIETLKLNNRYERTSPYSFIDLLNYIIEERYQTENAITVTENKLTITGIHAMFSLLSSDLNSEDNAIITLIKNCIELDSEGKLLCISRGGKEIFLSDSIHDNIKIGTRSIYVDELLTNYCAIGLINKISAIKKQRNINKQGESDGEHT